MDEFYIGQIFDGGYPPEVADWCNKSGKAKITEIEVSNSSERRFQIVEITLTKPTTEQIVAEYDLAMENYMKEVRKKRGYTTREPSDYINSTVERWRQDAVDWIAFRDAVLVYAMEIENKALETGEIPSIDEFVANMPTITWTID